MRTGSPDPSGSGAEAVNTRDLVSAMERTPARVTFISAQNPSPPPLGQAAQAARAESVRQQRDEPQAEFCWLLGKPLLGLAGLS
jgi:hypothetical protein